MDFFVRTLFSRFSELQSQYHSKWRKVNLAANVAGWTQFRPAQRWLDQHGLESLLNERGIDTPAARTQLLQDLQRLRD
jgi:hypothetical protein